MKIQLLVILFSVNLFVWSCEKEQAKPKVPVLVYEFTQDTEGWVGDFADYPTEDNEFYELTFRHDSLPSPLDTTDGALLLSGSNLSDDLFMFIKKKIEGLTPNTSYTVKFNAEVATNAPDGSVGIGGSPANSVYIKVGATSVEPIPIVDVDNYFRMNIDKGNQSQSGRDMIVIDDFANRSENFVYQLKTIQNQQIIEVTTGAQGSCWLILGTDSGFEGKTTIYFNRIQATFE